jgi:hypothetical protein
VRTSVAFVHLVSDHCHLVLRVVKVLAHRLSSLLRVAMFDLDQDVAVMSWALCVAAANAEWKARSHSMYASRSPLCAAIPSMTA